MDWDYDGDEGGIRFMLLADSSMDLNQLEDIYRLKFLADQDTGDFDQPALCEMVKYQSYDEGDRTYTFSYGAHIALAEAKDEIERLLGAHQRAIPVNQDKERRLSAVAEVLMAQRRVIDAVNSSDDATEADKQTATALDFWWDQLQVARFGDEDVVEPRLEMLSDLTRIMAEAMVKTNE
jgi:hypothetical protein